MGRGRTTLDQVMCSPMLVCVYVDWRDVCRGLAEGWEILGFRVSSYQILLSITMCTWVRN